MGNILNLLNKLNLGRIKKKETILLKWQKCITRINGDVCQLYKWKGLNWKINKHKLIKELSYLGKPYHCVGMDKLSIYVKMILIENVKCMR